MLPATSLEGWAIKEHRTCKWQRNSHSPQEWLNTCLQMLLKTGQFMERQARILFAGLFWLGSYCG
eukprot:scaffold39527_cov18-Tisochrysis_lutea.AAC.1